MMNLKKVIFLAALLSCCQHKPTSLSESGEILSKNSKIESVFEKEFSKNASTVMVDVRSSFEYESFHIPGSISFSYDEILERRDDGRQVVSPDLHKIARRLSYLGISPETQVVLVGKGKSGRGEEAAMAYFFSQLGIKKILASSIENFRGNSFSNVQRISQDPWKPETERIFSNESETAARIRNMMPQPASKARQAALQRPLSNLPLRVLMVTDTDQTKEITLPQDLKGISLSRQVLNVTDFIDGAETYSKSYIQNQLKLASVDIILVRGADQKSTLAMAHILRQSSQSPIILLD